MAPTHPLPACSRSSAPAAPPPIRRGRIRSRVYPRRCVRSRLPQLLAHACTTVVALVDLMRCGASGTCLASRRLGKRPGEAEVRVAPSEVILPVPVGNRYPWMH